jgi:hypothetical protein
MCYTLASFGSHEMRLLENWGSKHGRFTHGTRATFVHAELLFGMVDKNAHLERPELTYYTEICDEGTNHKYKQGKSVIDRKHLSCLRTRQDRKEIQKIR